MSMLSDQPFECPPWLLRHARQWPPTRMAIVGAETPLVLDSVRSAVNELLIEPVLVGDLGMIKASADSIDWNVEGLEIVAAAGDAPAVGVKLARDGHVAALMKGNVRTDELMRAAVQRKRGIRGQNRPSHVFHMSLPGSERSLCITDAVINVLPKVRQKIQIANNAASFLHALGNAKPKIALLSATEVPTSQIPSSREAVEVVTQAKAGAIPRAITDGPLALDVALSNKAAEIKGCTSPVAGMADILLVPNIEAGNMLFKHMVHCMSATAAGLVLGTTVPIALTSRADPPEARLASAALASIVAQSSDTN